MNFSLFCLQSNRDLCSLLRKVVNPKQCLTGESFWDWRKMVSNLSASMTFNLIQGKNLEELGFHSFSHAWCNFLRNLVLSISTPSSLPFLSLPHPQLRKKGRQRSGWTVPAVGNFLLWVMHLCPPKLKISDSNKATMTDNVILFCLFQAERPLFPIPSYANYLSWWSARKRGKADLLFRWTA